jgi:F-type H+-transporting ATPase subunit delta
MYLCIQKLLKTILQLDELTTVLISPSVSDAEKVQLLCDAVPEAPMQYRRFAQLVVKQGRVTHLRYIAYAYISLYRQEAGILSVKLTTALPIDGELSQRVARLMTTDNPDAKLEIENVIDTTIIGGFMLEANSVRLDASIKSALSRIENKIVDNNRRLV